MRALFLPVILLVLTAVGCGQRAPNPPSVVELSAMLQGDEPLVQIEATQWIVRLGPKAAETAPALTAALKSSNMTVRQHAAMALAEIGPEASVVPALTAALDDRDFAVRSAAAASLGKLGPLASSAIPALERFAEQSNQGERQGSSCNPGADALKKIRP